MFAYPILRHKVHLLCLSFAIIVAISAPISTAIASIACVLMLVAWLLSGKVFESLTIAYQQPTGKMILVFFVWLMIGTLYADTSWSEKIATLSSWKKLAYTYILLGLFYADQWKRYFIFSYVGFMGFAAVLGIVLWSLDLVIRQGAGHDPGIFMTNYATQSMAFIAALLSCLFFLYHTTSKQKKYILSIGIALFIFNIFFISGARTAYFALPIGVVFAMGIRYGYQKLPLIISIASLALILVVISSNTLQQRVNEGLEEFNTYDSSPHISSIGVRVIFVQNTLALIKENPLFGYGTSSFRPVYQHYAAKNAEGWRALPTTDPHNIYLYISLENGLIGLFIFLSYLVIAHRQGLQQGLYGNMAASFLITISVACLFNSYFKTFPEGHLLAFYMGILLSHRTPLTEKSKPCSV